MKCVGCDVEVSEAEFQEVQTAMDQVAEINPDFYERIVFWCDSLSYGRSADYFADWREVKPPVICRECYEYWLKQPVR